MDLLAIPTGVRVLAGIIVTLAASVVALPYFARPEDFFIRRLRPDPDRQITHSRLLAMVFLGGPLSVSAAMLGVALVTGEFSAYFLRLCLAATLVVGSFIGAGIYAYSRLWRYRKLSPQELGHSGSRGRSVFIRRETLDSGSRLLRIGLIIVALPAMWSAIVLAILTADLFS